MSPKKRESRVNLSNKQDTQPDNAAYSQLLELVYLYSDVSHGDTVENKLPYGFTRVCTPCITHLCVCSHFRFYPFYLSDFSSLSLI